MIFLINKYSAMSKPAKASFWFVVSNVVLKGISFITLPIFSRLLTTEQYGIVSVYQSWVSLISIVTSLTIWGGVFNVVMIKYPDRKEEILSSFQGLATTITLIAAILAMILMNPISHLFGISKFLVICIFIEILVQTPFNLWSAQQRYEYEYKKVIVITVVATILNPVIGIWMVLNTEYKAEARIISNLLIQIVIGFVMFIINQYKGKKYYSVEFWKFGFMFNVVLIPHYLSTQVLNQADRVMINHMCGTSEAGIYSVAYNFAMLLTLITNGINSSLTPYIYQSIKENHIERLKKVVTYIVSLIAIMDIICICIIPDVFKFMLPESYYDALWVIPPVTVGAFFLFLYPLFGSVEFYYEENKYVTYASCIGAVVNIALNYICISLFGYLAAAYTTLICYIGFTVCHYYFSTKIMKKNLMKEPIYNISAIILISITLVMVMVGIVNLYEFPLIRWGVLILIGVICIVMRKRLIVICKNMMNK